MKRSFLDSVLRGAEALAARDPVGTLTDRALLARFTASRDAAAFAMLVRRHGPLVWGVCRNLLTADADAEDAFQATFLALVHSAATIQRTEALGGWLHGVAYRVALKARRSAARRKTREKKAAVREADSPVPDAAWDDLQAAVHEEVCKLPDKLRLPFVLCGLQGRAQKDAAKELGWTIGTFSGRLSEARRKLLERLARRGVPVGVAVGAAVLGGVAGGASAPRVLIAKVMSVAGAPDAVSPSILSLARGVTHVYLTRTKLLAASVVLVGLLTTGIGANVLSSAGAQAPTPDQSPESVKRAIDFLRAGQTPRDRFEYKFVPVDKPLATSDLQRVLAAADQDGWSYCGAQELAQEKSGKVMPHMVFKRARTVAALPAGHDETAKGLTELAARQAEAEAHAKARQLEALAKERAALEDLAKARERAVAEERAKAEDALRYAEKAQRSAAEKEAMDKARLQELKIMQDKYEQVIRQMQLQLDKEEAGAATKPADPKGGLTTVMKLAHVDGKTAASELARLMPGTKIITEVSPNSITLTGPTAVVTEARGVIQKLIDVKPEASGATEEKMIVVAFPLKTARADEVAQAINKLVDASKAKVAVSVAGNSLLVAGPPAVVEQIKKILADLDAKAGPGK
jgi:RNA polymerase sigma factor (sigma-70 family)